MTQLFCFVWLCLLFCSWFFAVCHLAFGFAFGFSSRAQCHKSLHKRNGSLSNFGLEPDLYQKTFFNAAMIGNSAETPSRLGSLRETVLGADFPEKSEAKTRS